MISEKARLFQRNILRNENWRLAVCTKVEFVCPIRNEYRVVWDWKRERYYICQRDRPEMFASKYVPTFCSRFGENDFRTAPRRPDEILRAVRRIPRFNMNHARVMCGWSRVCCNRVYFKPFFSAFDDRDANSLRRHVAEIHKKQATRVEWYTRWRAQTTTSSRDVVVNEI